MFGLDPLEVLRAERLDWLIRVAAQRVIVDDHKRAAKPPSD